jgi:hypothetical protein
MGLAKLNVFVSGMDDPCSVDPRTWYVTIYDCDGNVLEFCGRKYAVLPARCGHLEIEVPPGCYRINAVWNFWEIRPGVYAANHFTDSAIACAHCGELTCVKLFNPSAHRCGFIYLLAVRDLAAQKAIAPDLAERAEAVVHEINQQLGRPRKLFELGHMEDFEKLVATQREAAEKGEE